MDETKVILNTDQKAVVERDVKKVYGTLVQLLNWVNEDALTVEMKETLPSIIDSCMKDVKKAIGWTGEESEREKEMKQSIGHYYEQKVKELEQALAAQNSIAGVPANIQLITNRIEKWWKVAGCNYVKDIFIRKTGKIEVHFGFSFSPLMTSYSETPVTDQVKAKTKIEYLEEKGFQFVNRKMGQGDVDVIDNDVNRKLLHELITGAFPSAKIYQIENYMRYPEANTFIIRSMEVIIHDINDVEQLIVPNIDFADDDDF